MPGPRVRERCSGPTAPDRFVRHSRVTCSSVFRNSRSSKSGEVVDIGSGLSRTGFSLSGLAGAWRLLATTKSDRLKPVLLNLAGDFLEQVVGRAAIRLGFKIQDDAVAQGGQHQGANVFHADVVTAVQERANFSAEDQGLRAARRAA